MIKRTLKDWIEARFFKGKAIVLLGPRQVGKTTLVQACLSGKAYLFLDGDDPDIRKVLTDAGVSKLKAIIGHHKIVFIDERKGFLISA